MPPINVRPLIKLTKEQWKALFRRTMERQQPAKGLEPNAAENIMRVFEPPVERKIGALHRDIPIGGAPGLPSGESIPTVERLPIEQARAKYFANPEQYRNPQGWAPPVRRLGPAASPTEELAEGMAYERIQQVPIVPPGVARTQRAVKRGLQSEAEETALAGAGVGPEDIREGVKPSTVMAEKGIASPEIDMEISQQLQVALVADQLWKDMGGGRSMGAKVWEMYRSSSRQKSHIKTPRDYFVSSFVRWKNDPDKFTRAYPRESKLLTQLWTQFEGSLGGK